MLGYDIKGAEHNFDKPLIDMVYLTKVIIQEIIKIST